MDHLPLDILIDVLSRLPIKSLVRCRCVCKPWLDLTHDSRLVHLHLHRTSQHTTNNPSLVVHTTACTDAVNFHTQMLFVENGETGSYTSVKLNVPSPNFVDFRVLGSCNGLLCLSNTMDRIIVYVFNPCNGDYIDLPELGCSKPGPRDVVGGFGFDQKTNQYKVVEVIYYNSHYRSVSGLFNGQSEVHVYGLGDSSWRQLTGVAPYLIFGQFASKAFVNGALHWVSSCPAQLIVSFDLAREVFDVIPRPEFGSGKGSYSLGVLRGRLSLTDSSFEDRIEIWVMNDYWVKESWTKYFTINFCEIRWNIRHIQILCFQKNGEVLLLYNHEALLSYNPRSHKTMKLTKLSIAGLPSWFEAVTFVGTLISPSRLSEK